MWLVGCLLCLLLTTWYCMKIMVKLLEYFDGARKYVYLCGVIGMMMFNRKDVMKTYLIIQGKQIDLEKYVSRARTIITLGRDSYEAYNVLALDGDEDADVFQCQFVRVGEVWKVQDGQWRTECPRGIQSRLQHACSMCMGRCVNAKTAQPTYSWRTPICPTLVNGNALTHEGRVLEDGDILSVGKTEILVRVCE